MDISQILMIVAMIGIFYFLLILPENKRKKKAEEMRSSIRKGERITTIGGLVGKVVQVNDSTVVFETSEDRVRIEIAKWGIQSTESSEQAAQKQGGLFGGARKDESKPDEPGKSEPEKEEKVEKAAKDEKPGFDPEIK